jgi:uncharacterized UBP type Zn finger protein
MIPTIEDVLAMYKSGDIDLNKAMYWINQHMEDSSLRDSFAMAALAGMDMEWSEDAMATRAYGMADAMLKARKR